MDLPDRFGEAHRILRMTPGREDEQPDHGHDERAGPRDGLAVTISAESIRAGGALGMGTSSRPVRCAPMSRQTTRIA